MSDSEPLDSKNRLAWELLLVVTVGLLFVGGVVAYSIHERPRPKRGVLLNNVRLVVSAADQYMFERHATQAAYSDLVGTGTDKYLRSISPVDGERYDNLIIYQTTTQLTISIKSGQTATYNL